MSSIVLLCCKRFRNCGWWLVIVSKHFHSLSIILWKSREKESVHFSNSENANENFSRLVIISDTVALF